MIYSLNDLFCKILFTYVKCNVLETSIKKLTHIYILNENISSIRQAI